MKNILFSIAVFVISTLIYGTPSAMSLAGIEPKSLSHNLASQEPHVMDCTAADKRVYLIPITRNRPRPVYFVIVENRSTGEIAFKKVIEIDSKHSIPDPCYFTCADDAITN